MCVEGGGADWLRGEKVVNHCVELKKSLLVKMTKSSTFSLIWGENVTRSSKSREVDKNGEVCFFLPLSAAVAGGPAREALRLRPSRPLGNMLSVDSVLLTTFFISGAAESFPSAMKTKHRLFLARFFTRRSFRLLAS